MGKKIFIVFLSYMLLLAIVSCSKTEKQSLLSEKTAPAAAAPGVKQSSVGSNQQEQVSEDRDAQNGQPEKEDFAGEFFGTKVPLSNYYFALRVVLTYNTPWGAIPGDLGQTKKRVWDDLLLSFEAFRRNVSVTPEELESEIASTLKGHGVSFDWKQDKEAYVKWVKETLGGPVELFENQMRHLVQLKKLQQQVLDSIKPSVTEKEAHQEFLDEYNTLGVELVQFDELEKAQEFYEKAQKRSDFWDKEKENEEKELKKLEKKEEKDKKAEGAAKSDEVKKEEKRKSKFIKPGFVSLEFLMFMWKFPREDVYKMIDKEAGSIYPPTPIYKGYGVFKVLEIRRAGEEDFEKRRESYYGQIRTRRKQEAFVEWLENLRKEADIKMYVAPPDSLFPTTAP